MIDVEKANYKIAWMCRLLGVPRSSFYAWRSRAETATAGSGRLERKVSSRRIASIARRFAVVVSQAAGLRGMPALTQVSRAEAYTSHAGAATASGPTGTSGPPAYTPTASCRTTRAAW